MGNAKQLFYACRDCNKGRNIPDGFEPMDMADVMAWLDCDPMSPNYAALAAEPEATAAGQDSRESAGL